MLKTIPPAILGGIMLLLFGLIASVGIKSLVDSKTNFSEIRNQVIVAVILTVGIGGAVIHWGNFSLAGIGLGAVVGVILNPCNSKKINTRSIHFVEASFWLPPFFCTRSKNAKI